MNQKLSPIEKFRPLWEGGKSVEQYNMKIGFKIRTFVVNQLTALRENNPNLFGQSEKDQLTKMVMDLKQNKTTIPLEQQNCTLEEYQKFLSDFFAHVDHEDRHGTVTSKTTSKFRLMSSFIDVLSSWGPIEEEMIKCKKYCQYKAVDIYKALKKGEIPKRGGPKELINNEKENNNNININNQNNNYIVEQNNHILTNNIVNQYNHISNNMEIQNIPNKNYNKNKKYIEKSVDINRNNNLRKLSNKSQNIFITKNYNVNVKKLTPDHYNKNNINTNHNNQYDNEIIYKTNIITQNNQMQDKTNINNYIRNKNNYISVNNNQNNYISHREYPKSDKNLTYINSINQNIEKNFDPRLHHKQNLQKQRTIDDTQQTKYLNTTEDQKNISYQNPKQNEYNNYEIYNDKYNTNNINKKSNFKNLNIQVKKISNNNPENQINYQNQHQHLKTPKNYQKVKQTFIQQGNMSSAHHNTNNNTNYTNIRNKFNYNTLDANINHNYTANQINYQNDQNNYNISTHKNKSISYIRKSMVYPSKDGNKRKRTFKGKYELTAYVPVKYETVDYYMLVEDVRLNNEKALNSLKRSKAKDILNMVLDSLEFLSYVHK